MLVCLQDESPKGARKGTLCVLDYCHDITPFCPANTTCVNEATEGKCACNAGFIDIRDVRARISLGLEDVW